MEIPASQAVLMLSLEPKILQAQGRLVSVLLDQNLVPLVTNALQIAIVIHKKYK
jgi:hypothetical protein